MNATLSVNERIELMGMESKAKTTTMENRYLEYKKLGLPSELIAAFTEMSAKTAKTVAGKTIETGKIVVDKIIIFIKENQHMVLGAIVGAAVGALGHLIPFIGPIIGPLTTLIGAGFGAVDGHRIDKISKGEKVIAGRYGIVHDIYTLAKEFFKFLADIFISILDKNSISLFS